MTLAASVTLTAPVTCVLDDTRVRHMISGGGGKDRLLKTPDVGWGPDGDGGDGGEQEMGGSNQTLY